VKRRKLVILFCALILIWHGLAEAALAEVAVVVRPDLPVDNLSYAELRKILLGDRQFWPSNIRVTLLIRAPVAAERDAVIKGVLQMTEAQFRQYWIGKVFRAESSAAPKTVMSNDVAAALVNSIPGSIAFIESTRVPPNLKVLRIDGLLPGERGYPLN
jgi:hypothetical protein